MRIASSTFVAVTMVLVAGAALAEAPSAAKPRELLTQAMQASMMEVELGKIAQRNAQSPGVNALGARLERDYGRIGKLVTMVSRSKGIALPTSLDEARRAQVRSLSAKTGADFDAAYSTQMVTDHEKAVELFDAAARSDDADLQELAKRALPVVHQDEQLAGSFQKLSASYSAQAVARK